MFNFLSDQNIIFVIIFLIILFYILSKSSDKLVGNAVKLSKIWGLSEIVIGATIVSIGTSLPEFSSSLIATLQGSTGFALGNSIGSIITNTSLILGSAALFGAIPANKEVSQKYNILIFVILLVLIPSTLYRLNYKVGSIPKIFGIIFLILIPIYIYILIKKEKNNEENEINDKIKDNKNRMLISTILKILLAAIFVAISASGMVSSAEIIATRLGVPDIIISSTIIAFGTSVPEISTAITAAQNKHGGLALGNVLGANIFNILLVLGASITFSPGYILVPESFYIIHFPALFIILLIFGIILYNKKKNEITKKEGIFLIILYIAYLTTNLLTVI